MDVEEILPDDFVFKFRGKTIVFAAVKNGRAVICPDCRLNLHKRSARRHYERLHSDTFQSSDHASIIDNNNNVQPGTLKRKLPSRTESSKQRQRATDATVDISLRSEDEGQDERDEGLKETGWDSEAERQDDDEGLEEKTNDGDGKISALTIIPTQETLDEIQGGLPAGLVESFLTSMRHSAYQATSEKGTFTVLVSDQSAPHLAFALGPLGPEYTLQKILLSRALPTPPLERDLSAHDDLMAADHLHAIEQGGMIGLERLLGSVVITEGSWIEVYCAEVYSRNYLDDPHAEPPTTNPSTVPTLKNSTQYAGRLKVAVLYDSFGNPRLEIGVTRYNYLVVSGNYNNTIVVGPSRCGKFPAGEKTQVFIKKARHDPQTLDSSALGLAQLEKQDQNKDQLFNLLISKPASRKRQSKDGCSARFGN
ncbi:hypothetical protein BGZ98_003869 [Dissophora globulifera]|nr:hypothetical protein BGZ98_003869 [Dissophora globulifera]